MLGYFHFTGSEGYSFGYCDTFPLVHTAHAHGPEGESPDEIRVRHLHTLAESLEAAESIDGSYPVSPALTDVSDIPALADAEVSDPCSSTNPNYTYQYISDADGSNYVLKALLSDSGYRYIHAQHEEDIEGMQLGVWCGEGLHKREFCIGPGGHTETHDHAHEMSVETSLPITLNISTTSVPGEISLQSTSFTFSEESVDTPHVDGIGHAHLYINGEKIGRVYETTVQLPELPAGTHTVTIGLYTNDHSTYTRDGEPLSDSLEYEVQ